VAKKKPRTPQPPRKVQAPQQRQAQRKPMDRDRQRNILFAVAGLGVAAGRWAYQHRLFTIPMTAIWEMPVWAVTKATCCPSDDKLSA